MKIYAVSGIFLRWSDDEIIKFLVIFILFSHCVLDWSEDSIMMVCDFPHVLEFSLYSQPVTIVFRPFISDFPIRHRYISFPAADSALNIIPAGLCDEKTAMASRACLFFRCFSRILLRPVDFRMIDSISEILSKVFRSEYIIFSCQSFTGSATAVTFIWSMMFIWAENVTVYSVGRPSAVQFSVSAPPTEIRAPGRYCDRPFIHSGSP